MYVAMTRFEANKADGPFSAACYCRLAAKALSIATFGSAKVAGSVAHYLFFQKKKVGFALTHVFGYN